MTIRTTSGPGINPPSGAQIALCLGGQRAVVVEVSGGLRSYEIGGHAVLDGYGAEEMCSGARGQILVPWPNRLRDGRYHFDGMDYQVPLTEPSKRNAIHGFLRWESWGVADCGDDWVVMEHVLYPREGYPFALRLSVEYRLCESGLTSTFTATNCGDRPCPYGMGAHPYLRVEAGRIDGSAFDFRVRRQIRQAKLDTTFVVNAREPNGLAWVRLWPDNDEPGLGLWMDERYPYYMLFTGDSLQDESRRRRSLGVEPMTCAPNAFTSGDGLIVLAPGEATTSRWGITSLARS